MVLDPVVLALLALVAGLYVRAIVVLRRRGWRVSAWQQAAWWTGWTLEAVALVSPIDRLAESLLSAHMAQHLLLADLGAPFLLAGLRTPVLQHYLPPVILRPLARQHGLRRAFRTLRQPIVAFVLYVLVLYGWHLSFAFEGALRHPVVHALQHESFLIAGILVWWSALEPKKARVPGELWKIPYITGARLAGMFLAMGLIFSRTPFYGGYYGDKAREHGLSALEDQQLAGGLMMVVDIFIVGFALVYFFWRASSDAVESAPYVVGDALMSADAVVGPPGEGGSRTLHSQGMPRPTFPGVPPGSGRQPVAPSSEGLRGPPDPGAGS
jgi:putative membrane protein